MSLASLVLLFGACATPAAGPTAGPSTPAPVTGATGATITRSASASISVVPQSDRPLPKIARVEVQPDRLELGAGEVVVLGAAAYDEQSQRLPLVRFSWSMVNLQAGSIDARGRFTAGDTPGEYSKAILATAVYQTLEELVHASGFASVTITGGAAGPILARIEVVPERVQGAPGQIIRLQAFPYDPQGRLVPDTRVTWSALKPVGRVSQVGQLGYLTVDVETGSYEDAISVEAKVGDRTLTRRVSLDVREPSAPAQALTVQVLPRQIYIAPGETFQFNAVAFDQDGKALPQKLLLWSAARTEAGSISSGGSFRAGATPGVYVDAITVQVSSLVGRQQLRATGHATVVVQAPEPPRPLAVAQVTPGSVTLAPGQTTVLGASARDDEGRPAKEIHVAWALADPRAGSVQADGRFTATRTPGRYPDAIRLTATQRLGEQTYTQEAYADVNVPGAVVRVEITPAEAVAATGETVHFSAVGYDAAGTPVPGLIFRWRVTDPRAGTIDPLGNFKAGTALGDYPGAIEVTAVQRRPR